MKKQYPDESSDLPNFSFAAKLHPFCVDVARNILIKLDELEQSRENRHDIKGTVLIFLPGEQEILTVKRSLEANPREQTKFGWDILVLHSRIPLEDSHLVFKTPEPRKRKIILSTNIAESSITIPDVEYVIDFCLTKLLETDPQTNYVSLQLKWADRQSCEQRKGRAGRVQKGRVFRLVPKNFYEFEMPRQHDPEMKRAPLDKVILDTKMLDLGSPKEILALAMAPPNLQNICKTVMNLKQMGKNFFLETNCSLTSILMIF